MEKLEEMMSSLSNLSAIELIALTKKLEKAWNVKAAPVVVSTPVSNDQSKEEAQTEFTVHLTSVPADKKMAVIKALRDITGLGLKESKDMAEGAPKIVKESVSKEEAELIQSKLVDAGGVVELK